MRKLHYKIFIAKPAYFAILFCSDMFYFTGLHIIYLKLFRCQYTHVNSLKYRVFKKNAQMFVCLISPEPMNRFLNHISYLKSEIHM